MPDKYDYDPADDYDDEFDEDLDDATDADDYADDDSDDYDPADDYADEFDADDADDEDGTEDYDDADEFDDQDDEDYQDDAEEAPEETDEDDYTDTDNGDGEPDTDETEDYDDDGLDLEDWPDNSDDATDEDGDGDTDARDALIKKLRAENAKHRVRNNEILDQAESAVTSTVETMLTGLADSIGYDGDLDPEALAEYIGKSRNDAAAARRDLAIHKAATAANVNTEDLLDSRSFITRIDALDPAGQAYAEAVNAEVRKYAEAHPNTTANNRPARSGGDFTAAQGNMPTPQNEIERLAENRRKRRS